MRSAFALVTLVAACGTSTAIVQTADEVPDAQAPDASVGADAPIGDVDAMADAGTEADALPFTTTGRPRPELMGPPCGQSVDGAVCELIEAGTECSSFEGFGARCVADACETLNCEPGYMCLVRLSYPTQPYCFRAPNQP